MGYKVVEKDKRFSVIEQRKLESFNEDIVIKSFADRTEAKTFMRKLNGGIGFNGWTPHFFLIEVNVK